MTYVIGIDPGQDGGIAWLGTSAAAMQAQRMPETERDVCDILERLVATGEGLKAYIESVHSMPKQGVSSSFKFGRNYGFLRGCLIGLKIPFEEITPQRWQKGMSCLTKGDKNVSKARAQQLFPHLKITHAISDATLIAEWGRRQALGLKDEERT